MYIYGGLTDQSLNLGEPARGLTFGPNPDNMPTNPLPPSTVRPEPMPTTPLVPRNWCPQLSKIESKTCFSYAPQEISISRTATGHLNPDVVLVQPGGPLGTVYSAGSAPMYKVSCAYLIIRDFGVDWRHVKLAAKQEQLFKDWLHRFETDKSLAFRIVGYSDCVGVEGNNFLLRRGRARNVFKLLGKSARSRVTAVVAAPAHTYLTDNSTVPTRANNRSVVIEFFANGVQTV